MIVDAGRAARSPERAAAFDVELACGGRTVLRARDAAHFLARLRGLHGLMPLAPDEALVIRPCRAIHTWFMPAAIDVAFVDGDGRVMQRESVPPGRWASCARATAVVEMAAGAAERLGIAPGVQLIRSKGEWS